MRSKIDAKLARRANKPNSPVGGKALQRLFFYLSERDPARNNDVLATIEVPKVARPRFGLTKSAPRARRGRAAPAAKSFASAIVDAATALRARRSRGRRRRVRARAARGPAAAPVWQAIGPSLIPNGQTYGSNRVDVIGRVSSIAVDPQQPKHLLLGAAGGGIWESADTGTTWQARTDFMPSLAIGAVTFDPNAPKRVYAGSGEGNFYANLGAGVYRSSD